MKHWLLQELCQNGLYLSNNNPEMYKHWTEGVFLLEVKKFGWLIHTVRHGLASRYFSMKLNWNWTSVTVQIHREPSVCSSRWAQVYRGEGHWRPVSAPLDGHRWTGERGTDAQCLLLSQEVLQHTVHRCEDIFCQK